MKRVELTPEERAEKAKHLEEMEEKAKALGFKSYEEQRRAIAKAERERRTQSQVNREEQTLYKQQQEELEKRAVEAGYKDYADQFKQQFLKRTQPSDNFSTEKVVVPPPMVKKIEALEFTDPKIPGEIKIDTAGRLLKRYFAYEGQIGSLIDQYNNFITYTLSQHLFSRTLTLPTGVVTFENIQLNRPMIKSMQDRVTPLYPQQARNNGYSYTADMYVDMVLNKGSVNEERIDKAFLGKIPVMLGSELCWMSRLSEEERVRLGESINEAFGYFVIKGNEKIILTQEKLRANRIFVFSSNNKGDIVCKVTNNTIAGSTQITMARGKKSGAFKVHLGFLGRLGSTAANKLGRTISVFQIFRMLGVKDPKVMIDYVQLFTKKEYAKKIYVALQPSIVKLTKVGDDIEYVSKKKGLGDLPYEIRRTEIMKDLLAQLFPQVESNNTTVKLYMLSMMIARISEVFIGVRELDDRDNWGNKQLVTAGKSLELLFSSIWKEAIQNAQLEIEDKKLSGLKAVQRVLNPSFITDNFIESFTANNWGVQSSYLTKENITDILKRDSILSVYSHLTKINTPGSSKVKSSKIRMVQMSQLGYVDAAETPEGEMCCLWSTPVLMANGDWKMIRDIQEGDVVVTVNRYTMEKVASPITKPFTFFSSDKDKVMYRITTADREIECTGDHPFLTQYGWLPADKLNPTLDMLCVYKSCENDSRFVYQKIRSITLSEPAEVCDFTTLSENHSFIAAGFVVHNCGLTKNTAMTAYMSLDRPEAVVEELLDKYVADRPNAEQINPYIYNGVFKGWVNGKEMKEFAVALKRGLKLPKDTAIVLERDGYFNIYTDACRPTRPLMLVDKNGRLVIEKKNLWDTDFETLLREGCVEYVDAWEQENIMLAQSLDDVNFRKRDIEMAARAVNEAKSLVAKEKSGTAGYKNAELTLSQAEMALKELVDIPVYTHSEMDPTAIFSIAVGVIPYPETNPGPRLTYQAGMGKQALGIYHSNHAARFDTTSKVLAYPSRPMFETQMNAVIGLDELPAGESVIIAFTTYTGFSQEDAIVMSQGAIDRGLFRSIVYKTYKSVRKAKTKSYHEEFARPEVEKGKEDRYAAIGENGIPIVGSFVREGDCLIGKTRKNFATGKVENASSFVEVKQEGVVDRVLISTNADGEQVVKVKIRQVRKPTIGGKYACYTPDHEVLTLNRSWIPIGSLTLDDKVATLVPDPNGDRLVYQKPTALQNFDFEGQMYHIQSQQIDLCVTKNHRMYVKPRDRQIYTIKTADEIYGKRVNYKRDAVYAPPLRVDFLDIPAYNNNQVRMTIPIRPFCVVFGIFIAEGWVSTGTRFPNRIDIAGNKPRVQVALLGALNELGWQYSNGANDDKIYIWENQVGEYLRQFSVGAVNKFLPPWCFTLSQNNSRVLLEALMCGDGYKSIQTGSYTYYTSSERLAKDVTQLALHAGWSANSKIRTEAGTEVEYENRTIKTTHDAYAIPIIRAKNNPQVNHGKVNKQGGQVEEYIDYQGPIHCCTVPSGIIYVRRNGKPVWSGNSRYAQKGTIGMILPEEDMPFSANGVRPDILIDPLCMPSRMTIGKMIEIVASKVAAFSGERVNATAFRKFEVQEFMRNLKQYGYSGTGSEKLYSGYTGKPFTAQTFIGPCYYQKLRHEVEDKIQMRARGGVSQLTHQPVEGRKRGGGLRIGEMERDAIISHGASAFLRERLCLVSDAYETVYCSTCGTMAIGNVAEDTYVCRECEDQAVFGKCTVPYAYKLLTQLLLGAGISTKFTMKEVKK